MFWFRKRTKYSWRISWQAANANTAEDFEIDEYSPKDSVDEESYWPLPEIDLLAEAHWLVEHLLGENISID